MTASQELHYTEGVTSTSPYAVGILETGENVEDVNELVAQAVKSGFDVLIAASDSDVVSDRFKHEVSFVDVDATGTDTRRDHLVTAAREKDLEGLVIWNPGNELNFEVASRTLEVSAPFAIPSTAMATPERTERLVGVPAYNESVGIGSVVLAAQQYADEVVVIDDGSSDDTVDIALRTDATVLEHGTNKGKGRAIQTFFAYARASDYESFVILDGDGQHLPEDIPEVVEPVEDGAADLVVGSRYLEDGTGEETPLHRRVGQQVLDYLTLGSSGTKLSDTQSGFRAFSPEAVDRLTIRTDGMGVESEMISTAQDHELAIEEVPIDVRYEGIDGQTFNPVHHGVGVAMFLLKLIRDRHPLLFFGGPGVIIGGAGVLFGLDAVLLYNNQGVFAPGQTMVSLLLTVIGLLGVFCGLVLNRMSNMICELKKE